MDFKASDLEAQILTKNMKLVALLLVALFGVAAAFFRPAVPVQVQDPAMILRGGANLDVKDPGLDNLLIEEDKDITPARKCGFCMGVSTGLRRI